MPGRSFTAQTQYRYGFNGKEKDLETTETTTFDYGFRIYNPGLGRFLSVDPLMKKYPNLTPYNYTANNPMLYIDKDGKDYIIYICHDSKTILIISTYHIVKGDAAKNAKMGVEHWNKQKKFQYTVGTKEKPINYSIIFRLNVVEHSTEDERNKGFYTDEIAGKANIFITVPNLIGRYGTTYSVNDQGNNLIYTENSSEAQERNTPAHEIGHTLGLEHFTDNLMEEGSTRTASEYDKIITVGMVSRILNTAQIGALVEKENDKQTSPKSWSTVVKKIETKATKPENFYKGKVTVKNQTKKKGKK